MRQRHREERAAATGSHVLIYVPRPVHITGKGKENSVSGLHQVSSFLQPANHNNEKQRRPFRRHSLISSSHYLVIVAMCTILNYARAARTTVQRAALLLTIDFGQGGRDAGRTTCASSQRVSLCPLATARYWKFQSALIGSTFCPWTVDAGRASFVCSVNRIVRGLPPRATGALY
jgi:hypothetical protein